MTSVFSTSQFQSFLESQTQLIDVAYREVEELQRLYQGRYLALKADRDKAVSALAGSVGVAAAAPKDLGATLCTQAEARLAAEQAAIAARVGELKTAIPARQHEADLLLAGVQQEAARVRELNPELDCKEEQMKTDIAAGQQRLDDLNDQIAGLARGLGFVTHAVRISRLDRERKAVIGRLHNLQRDLRGVRTEWKSASEGAVRSETGLLSRWQGAMAELAELRREQEILEQDPRALSWRRTCVFLFENLREAPADAPGHLAASIKAAVELNSRVAGFQAALGSVAGVLGLANGMKRGLQAFAASVRTLQEQEIKHREYLSPLKIEPADETRDFGRVWPELAEKARDEKALAEHPADFVAIAAPYLAGPLSQAQITAYFDALGAALKRATNAWSRS